MGLCVWYNYSYFCRITSFLSLLSKPWQFVRTNLKLNPLILTNFKYSFCCNPISIISKVHQKYYFIFLTIQIILNKAYYYVFCKYKIQILYLISTFKWIMILLAYDFKNVKANQVWLFPFFIWLRWKKTVIHEWRRWEAKRVVEWHNVFN